MRRTCGTVIFKTIRYGGGLAAFFKDNKDYEAAEKMMKQAKAWADKAIAEAATAPIDARANPPADAVQAAPPAPQTTSQGVWQ